MKVCVKIAGVIVHVEQAHRFDAMSMALYLFDQYEINTLRQDDISANVYIDGVPSRMNDPSFLARPETYDELFFKEISL